MFSAVSTPVNGDIVSEKCTVIFRSCKSADNKARDFYHGLYYRLKLTYFKKICEVLRLWAGIHGRITAAARFESQIVGLIHGQTL